MSETFESLELAPWIVRQTTKLGKVLKKQTFSVLNVIFFLIIRLGLKRPTPIQVNCIPKILGGSDCIGAAKTGYSNGFFLIANK